MQPIYHKLSTQDLQSNSVSRGHLGCIDGKTYHLEALSEEGFLATDKASAFPIGYEVILQSLICSHNVNRSVLCQFDYSKGDSPCVVPVSIYCRTINEKIPGQFAFEFRQLSEMQKWKIQHIMNCSFYVTSLAKEESAENVEGEQVADFKPLISWILDKMGK